MWEKENFLVTSKFSFSHNVFYPLGRTFPILIKSKIVVCISLSLEESKICRLGKG